MLSFEEINDILSEIVDDIPQEIFNGLNGGVILKPDVMPHPEGTGEDLYILGQYHYNPYGLGRFITINYGSFRNVHGSLPVGLQKEKLREVLYHELTHHLESLAGDDSLVIEDMKNMEKYRERMDGK
ncbi:MAG: metallopeptidase family protein [Oscillospiraceae bacterium]|jgi:hypothetical protein|nr:metallopeptidase family protein [Oscillospiraceae bacterium]